MGRLVGSPVGLPRRVEVWAGCLHGEVTGLPRGKALAIFFVCNIHEMSRLAFLERQYACLVRRFALSSLIRIWLPPRGQSIYFRCRIGSLGNSSTASVSSYPEGTVDLSYN